MAVGFDVGSRRADLVPSDMGPLSLGLYRCNAVVASPDFLRTHGKPIVPTGLYGFRCVRAWLANKPCSVGDSRRTERPSKSTRRARAPSPSMSPALPGLPRILVPIH